MPPLTPHRCQVQMARGSNFYRTSTGGDVASETQPEEINGTIRQRIVAWAKWGVAHEPQIHYQQRRPVDGLSTPGKSPLYTDCSGFVTLCYKWASAPDPNGGGYGGTIYTGTLLRHCSPIRESQLLPGDLVVFGGGAGSHVVVMVGAGANGLVVSHGSEHAPNRYPLSAAKTYFASPARPLRCPGVGPLLITDSDPDVDLAPPEDIEIQDDPSLSNEPSGDPGVTP